MPRQQINLDPYRDEIVSLFQHGISSDSISRTLESRYNIQVRERTIQSRLRKWGLTDKAMLKLLRQEGYDISERTLRRLRFRLGLHARAERQGHIPKSSESPEQEEEESLRRGSGVDGVGSVGGAGLRSDGGAARQHALASGDTATQYPVDLPDVHSSPIAALTGLPDRLPPTTGHPLRLTLR
ncbi:hypothetical protein N7474_000054 [Penicillium riverlandense]|uniref:uncharacterized protein n=1 Tax=Penicillium riverlandense TaxID=1903569 RepID=UPI0025491CAB|nr:uncharacterized protein N7474_000054 [Penicillium riverlandense]KAJ5831743.1 hypothetical protein N7474_000054 [Penicillium riverlandense]